MKYSHIIWDFNGTIIDDLNIGIKTVNTLLKRRGLKQVESIDYYHSVFGFPVIDYYRKLGFDFDKESFDDVAVEWVDIYLENCKEAQVHDGTLEVLVGLREKGVKQVILSATEQEMLLFQVGQLKIDKYFDDILGIDNILGAGKIDIALDWKKRTNPEKVVLIGDTTHDHEVAEKIGADCILIAAGHQSRKTLSGCNVPVLNSIKEVWNVI